MSQIKRGEYSVFLEVIEEEKKERGGTVGGEELGFKRIHWGEEKREKEKEEKRETQIEGGGREGSRLGLGRGREKVKEVIKVRGYKILLVVYVVERSCYRDEVKWCKKVTFLLLLC